MTAKKRNILVALIIAIVIIIALIAQSCSSNKTHDNSDTIALDQEANASSEEEKVESSADKSTESSDTVYKPATQNNSNITENSNSSSNKPNNQSTSNTTNNNTNSSNSSSNSGSTSSSSSSSSSNNSSGSSSGSASSEGNDSSTNKPSGTNSSNSSSNSGSTSSSSSSNSSNNPGSTGSSSSGGSSSSSNQPSQPSHTHNWVEHTVWHDDIGHYERVEISPAWEEGYQEPIYEWVYWVECTGCGARFDTMEGCVAHQLSFSDEECDKHPGSRVVSEEIIVGYEEGTIYHEATYDNVWVVDTPGYYEKYYTCSCGARK